MRSLFPLFRTPQDWLGLEGHVLLTWGIFNPNGPTLYCVGIRDTGARGEVEVFYRWMHFLGGKDYCLGYVSRDDDFVDRVSQLLFDTVGAQSMGFKDFALFGTIPSFFLSVLPEPADQRLQAVLAHSDAIRNANWGREWYLLRKHGADLFGRAGEEVRAALEQMRADADPSDAAIHKILDINFARHQHIPTFRNWSKSQVESRTLADGDIEAWWNTIQQLEFRSAAYQLFAEAWIGASAPERTDLTVVTPFAEVRQFLHHFHHPCFGE